MRNEREVSRAVSGRAWCRVDEVARCRVLRRALRTEWGALHDASPTRASSTRGSGSTPGTGASRRDASCGHPDRARSGRAAGGLMPLRLEHRRVLGSARAAAGVPRRDARRERLPGRGGARGAGGAGGPAFADALRDAAGGWDVLDLLDLRRGLAHARRPARGVPRLRRAVTRRGRSARGSASSRARPSRPSSSARGGATTTCGAGSGWRSRPATGSETTSRPRRWPGRWRSSSGCTRCAGTSDGGSQGIKGPGVEAFHRDATGPLAERGRLRMYTMKAGGAGGGLGVRHRARRRRSSTSSPATTPAWRDSSVGLVLVGETFKDAIGPGLREYDFLRGTETYKSDWVSKRRGTRPRCACSRRRARARGWTRWSRACATRRAR